MKALVNNGIFSPYQNGAGFLNHQQSFLGEFQDRCDGWNREFELLGNVTSEFHIHSGNLTWQWNIHHLKMYFLFKMGIFRCYVCLPEGISLLAESGKLDYCYNHPWWGCSINHKHPVTPPEVRCHLDPQTRQKKHQSSVGMTGRSRILGIITLTIHVWYICLDLVVFNGKIW